jgi:hypothetical protein
MNIPLSRPFQSHQYLLLAILALGLFLRFQGLVWTLPYYFWGDETRVVGNGISLHQSGTQNYQESLTLMANYPPYRAWEVAITRAFLFGVMGQEQAHNGVLVLYGRMFSLAYGLFSILFLYHLGRRVSGEAYVGLIAALLFTVWDQTVFFGQRVLADGAGLMFFCLAAYLSLLSYQERNYRYWVGAVVAGLLAAMGKYNYITVLMLPGLAALAFLWQQPGRLLAYALIPAALLSLPLIYLARQTISTDDIYYQFLNETAQIEGDLRSLQLRGYTPDSPEWRYQYERYPLTPGLRAATNYQVLLLFLPPYLLALVLLAPFSLYFPHRTDKAGLLALALCSLATIGAFSFFRVVEGRQLFGAIMIFFLLAALAIVQLGKLSPFAGGALVVLLAGPMLADTWRANLPLTKPDSRVATVNWLLEYARNGTGVAIENEPYEFWVTNGYHADKRFNAVQTYRLFDQEPPAWENQGFYYLVADQSYEWRGGYYAGHEKQALWDQYVEVVARFEGEAYSGPDRIILRAFRPQVKVEAQFGGLVNFYGYNLNQTEARPGDELALKYYWWALARDGRDYVVFTHLISPTTGQAIAQFDRLAGHNGAKPSSQWEAREWLFDELSLSIPADTPPGEYILQMGLYDSLTGERLPLAGSGETILRLTSISIGAE